MIFQKDREDVLNSLHSDIENGLSSEQAQKNAQAYGRNEFTKGKGETLFKRLFKAASEPMIIMLIVAGFIALAVNVFRSVQGGEADYLEVIGVFVAISLSVIITVVMEGRSAKAFEALNAINENLVVKAIRNGKVIMLNQKEIVCGDILELATGDRIPADGRLLTSMGLMVEESALTGESRPSKKEAELVIQSIDTPVAEQANMLFSGTYVASGFAKMIVTSVGDSTEFGKIAKELTTFKETSTPLQEKLARLGKMITIFGVIAALIVFVSEVISFHMAGTLTIEHVMEAFVTSIVLIVAAVPEGLPTIVAVSLSINIIKLSKQNALVKKMIASETIGSVNIICSDKTGTLTENKMTVMHVWDKEVMQPESLKNKYMLENFTINSTADINDQDMFIGNPTEGALLIAAQKANINYKEERKKSHILHVFPFTSNDKHMTTVIKETDNDSICYVKGSPESVMAMCALTSNEQEQIKQEIYNFESHAYRVLAFAHKVVKPYDDYEAAHDEMEKDMVFDGFVAILDPLRSDVKESIERCQRAGVELKMLTGDNITTAIAIANELHLLEGNHIALEAKDIEKMDDEQLRKELVNISVIARSTPTIKMRIVNLLKEMGNVVAVTGDGINDAPALKNADVGIAMGISGTEVSKEASDIVLLNDSFVTIVNAIQWGRGIYENFKRFINFQLTVNVASVIVVLCSILLGYDAPFTALQLLWINIIMDGPPALTLGLEPSTTDLMKQKPIKRSENIISKTLLVKIVLTAVYMAIIFLLQYTFNFLGVEEYQMPTVLFTLFALFQLFNAFNARELHRESIFKNFFKNKLMLIVISITFVLQIIIIQFAGAFFGTVPLPINVWIQLFGVACSVVVLSELVKLILRLVSKK